MVFPGTDQSGGPIFPSDEQVPDIVTDIDDLLSYFPDNFVNTISAVHSRMGFRSVWYYIDLVKAQLDALEPSAPELNPIVVRLDAVETDVAALQADVAAHELVNDAHRNNLNNPHAVSWQQIGQKPATFTPSTHSHAAADLPTATGVAQGAVILEQSTNDASNESGGKAATPSAVKAAYDLAASKAAASHTHSQYLPVAGNAVKSSGALYVPGSIYSGTGNFHGGNFGSDDYLSIQEGSNYARIYLDGAFKWQVENAGDMWQSGAYHFFNWDANDYILLNSAINQAEIVVNGIKMFLAGASAFTPGSAGDGTRDLGSASFRWRNLNYTGTLNDTSDIRSKTNVQPLNLEGLADKLLQLEVVRFDRPTARGVFRHGLVAQQVEGVIPELVVQPEEEGQMKQVSFSDLAYLTLAGLQEAFRRIAVLEGA